MLYDTGARRAEILNMRVDDLDTRSGTIDVTGKGSRPRTIAYGNSTAVDLDRYLRVRGKHPRAATDWLWLSQNGQLSASAFAQMLHKRGAEAGIGPVHPHQFRHSFAHAWLAQGGQEQDLMRLAGWRSRTMLNRYGASAAAERARNAHRIYSPRDQL